MTIGVDAVTEQQRSASAATTTVAHTAGASVRGVLVAFVHGGAATTISNVSYGGTTLVQYGKAADTATEPGSAEWWFAPHTTSGNQNVSYNAAAVGSNIHVVVITLTSGATPYVIGQRTIGENTTSHTLSVTTGYVGGMGFGAFYGGGADPASYTYATEFTLVHDWDMGAFYSEVFRHLNAVSSPAYLREIGGTAQAGTDDVAFAAVYITDGIVLPGVGAVSIAGLPLPAIILPGVGAATAQGLQPDPKLSKQPFIWTELKQNIGLGAAATNALQPTVQQGSTVEGTALPGVGAVATNPLAPTELKDLAQGIGVGAVALGSLVPTLLRDALVLPGVGLVAINALTPTEVRERNVAPGVGLASAAPQQPTLTGEKPAAPGVGLATTAGLAPTLAGERPVTPTVGLATAAGLGGSLWTELTVLPTVGAAVIAPQLPLVLTAPTSAPTQGTISTAGLAPTILAENATAPQAGLAAINSLAPSLTTELAVAPQAGYAEAAGQVPTLSGDFVVTATVEPLVGVLYTAGAPHVVFSGEVRGHVATGRRWRTRYYGETSLGPTDAAESPEPPEPLPPDPVPVTAQLEPVVAAAELGAMDARIAVLEVEAAKRMKRRRDEEAIISFLMRVA